MSGDMLSGFPFVDNTTTSGNVSLTCAARSLEGASLPYSPTLLTTVRIFQSIFFCILSIFGPPFNILVIVLVARNKILQTRSFGIALQVVVMDLVLSLTACLSAFISSVANRWMFGEHICVTLALIFAITVRVRTLLMLVFVLDRFLSVFAPFFYPKHRLKIIAVLSTVSWLVALTIGIVQLPQLLDCYRFSSRMWMCSALGNCSSRCSIFVWSLLALIVLPAIIIPIILYSILFFKAWRVMRATPSSMMKKTYEKEWKATITFALLFISVVIVTLPGVVISIGIRASDSGVGPTLYVFSNISLCLLFLLPITDPLVIMRHKDVNDILKKLKHKIFCCYQREVAELTTVSALSN